MNSDTKSSFFGQESLAEEEKLPQQRDEEESEVVPREMDWKQLEQGQLLRCSIKREAEEEAVDEIGISGSKVEEGALARDVRRLKSATLDRMGKMLKIHSKSGGEKSDELAASTNWGDGEDPSRKQKFNSLTRMLRFQEKEEKLKSAGQHRGVSLTRMLRRNATAEGDNLENKPDEQTRGIFSRILSQIRGRMSKTNSATKNSQQKNMDDSELSSKLSSSDLAMSELSLESPCCPIANTNKRD